MMFPERLLGYFACVALASALKLSNSHFHITIDDDTGAIDAIINPADPVHMNWLSSSDNALWLPVTSRWGLGYSDQGKSSLHRTFWESPKITAYRSGAKVTYRNGIVELAVTRTLDQATQSFTERYTFTNLGNTTLALSSAGTTALAIYTPFNDHYTSTTDVLEHRCHAHIWATGGSSSWIKTTRMGGRAPHLGLVLTEGSLSGYSVEARNTITSSNTRGVFQIHPSLPTLEPGEQTSIAWSLFWHDDWEDFFEQGQTLSTQFINFNNSRLSAFKGDNISIEMTGAVGPGATVNGQTVSVLDSYALNVTRYGVTIPADKTGEKFLTVSSGVESSRKNSTVVVQVLPSLEDLMSARSQFITTKQQVPESDALRGDAYAPYDNQMKGIVLFDTAADRNTARERVGMGVFLGRYLLNHSNTNVEASFLKYYSYVCTKLQNNTGTVYDGPLGSGDNRIRLYNWPWVMQLHLAAHKLNLTLPSQVASISPIDRFLATVKDYYNRGGASFYAINIPVLEGLAALKSAGRESDYQQVLSLFVAHGENMVRVGTNYPASEVNFEQSIVAPAAIFLLELYRVTANSTWFEGAEPHFRLLTLFGGRQPDYHLYDVAIRHWDGYWFGKDRMWGDVFPHYWSSLTGLAMHQYAKATNDTSYETRALDIMKANLALFAADGSASCAWLYPLSVNGRAGHYKDAYANDQDWALAHYLALLADP